MTFIDEIYNLIELKTEGEYWDFKESWHSNKASLLHDIICMANNQAGRDAYLIFGVSDSKSSDGAKIKGVSEDNRKDQQQLITFLRDKKFAGDLRPMVYLQTIEVLDENQEYQSIDVVIIKNSNKTPFFLMKDFEDNGKRVRAGYIYTRIGDTNTPIDSIADMDKIEYLWRKHFGIDLSATEKLLMLLDHPNEWVGSFNDGDCKYHKYFPEFQIHINDNDDQSRFSNNRIIRNLADHQLSQNYSVSDIIITYHSTVLYKDIMLYLDGFRHLIPLPQVHTVYQNEISAIDPSLTYLFFDLNSISGKLFNCFARAEDNWYCEKWDLRPGVGFLIFWSKSEQKIFDAFVKDNLKKIDDDYMEALKKKGYVHNSNTEEFFIGGWSKANEIKSWHLYEKFMDLPGTSLIDKIPDIKQ